MSEISEEATRLIDEFECAAEDAVSDYTMACGASYKNLARHNLEDYIAELEAKRRWRVVADGELPELGKEVIFYDSIMERRLKGVYVKMAESSGFQTKAIPFLPVMADTAGLPTGCRSQHHRRCKNENR